MRLNELMGVKDQAGKLIKRLQHKRDRSIAYVDASEIVKQMERLGYKYVASGHFGATFRHPSGYIIKLIDSDPCYIKFVEYCKSNQNNPHLPKFKSKKATIFGKDFYMVRMEELIKNTDSDDEYLTQIFRLVKHTELHSVDDLLLHVQNTRYYVKYADLVDQELGFWETVLDLKTLTAGECSFDMHSDNSMLRDDGTRVVIDPWASSLGLDTFFSEYEKEDD